MIDKKYFEEGHIKSDTYILLDNGSIDNDSRQLISEHLSSCNKCSSAYADYLTADVLLDLPDEFNEVLTDNIMQNVNQIKVSRRKFTAVQYFKLATAAVLAISFYSTGVFNSFFNITNDFKEFQNEHFIQSNNFNISNKIDKRFTDFAKKINFNGVDLYEKK